LQERIARVDDAMRRLSRGLGRSPTPTEIAEDLGLSPEDVVEALEAATANSAVSLDLPLGPDDDGDSLLASLGAEDESYAKIEYLDAIAPAMRALPERDRRVLQMRFVEDLTQSEIAERIGVSQMHVSRLMRRAIGRLQIVADAA
jgi:RNA polymerase sigma-B factor